MRLAPLRSHQQEPRVLISRAILRRRASLILRRALPYLKGVAAGVAIVAAHAYVSKGDYEDAVRAEAQAREARADAIAQRQAAIAEQRDARYQRYLAESAQRLQEMQRGDWR